MSELHGYANAERREIVLAHPASKILFDYWNALRRQRAAPRRSELEPAALAPILSSLFVLEPTTAGDAAFRLAGTNICAIFGRELRDHNFVDLFGLADRPLTRRILVNIVERQHAGVLRLRMGSADKRTPRCEALLLPLEDSDSRRIVGVMTFLSHASALFPHEPLGLKIEQDDCVDPTRCMLALDPAAGPTPAMPRRLALVANQADPYPQRPTLTDPWVQALGDLRPLLEE